MTSLAEQAARLSPQAREVLARELIRAGTVFPVDEVAEPVAVVGIGCRFPGEVVGPESFWRLLVNGEDAISEVPADRWDADEFYDPDPLAPGRMTTKWGGFVSDVAGFDADFFGITPREAAAMDPQQRILLEVAWEALEHAGIPPDSLGGSRTAVMMGLSAWDYTIVNLERGAEVNAYVSLGNLHSTAVGRISYLLGLQGPAVAVDTACSSSLVAVHLACQSLRLRESELALAGGVELSLSPFSAISLSKWSALSPRGRCRTFDAGADGFVRGEGAGVVVLKRLADALRDGNRVLAVVRGSAVNQDGRSNGLTAPNVLAQRDVITDALRAAAVAPDTVNYVEAHGTGTVLGDPIEFEALAATYGRGEAPCALGAVKTNLGHLEAAAGAAGFIKAVLALGTGRIPPNLHFSRWNPAIDPSTTRFFVPTDTTPWPTCPGPRRAGVSSFGVGGTNAHVVLEQAPAAEPVARPAQPVVSTLVLSGKTPARIASTAKRLADWMAGEGAVVPLSDIAYTLKHHRAHHTKLAAVCARDRAQAVVGLQALAAGEPGTGVVKPYERPHGLGTVFVYSGQGSQWPGMGQRLLADEPAFSAAVAELEPAFVAETGFSLQQVLAGGEPLVGIARIQPVLVGMQLALTALWRSYGVEPDAVIGHSMGEVTAAVVAGALSPAEGLRVIATRSRLMSRLAGQGAMALLELNAEATAALVADYPDVTLAVYASPSQTVIAGPPDLVDALIAVVEAQGRLARRIEVDVASHHSTIDPILPELRRALSDLRPATPKIPLISTTGHAGGEAPRFDADYWAANLRNPVRFSQAVAAAATDHAAFIEVSPHPLLTYAIDDTLASTSSTDRVIVTSAMKRGQDETLFFHTQLAALGVTAPDAGAGRLADIPPSPWLHSKYWVEAASPEQRMLSGRGPLRSAVDPQTVFSEIDISTELMPVLRDHRVHGSPILPAVMLLKLVLAEAAQAFSAGRLLVREVVFHRSLVLADAQRRTVQLVLQGDPPGPVSFECYSMEPVASGSSGWSLFASGIIDTGEPDAADDEPQHPETLRTSCPDVIPGPSFYRLLAEHGLQYGPGFQAVEEIWRRDGEAIARLRPPVQGSSTVEADDFDVPVLDACLQVLAATFSPCDGQSHDTYLPVGVAELRVHGPCVGGAWCHALLRSGPDPEPDTVAGDVFLLGEDGQVAVTVRGVRLQRIPGAGLAGPATGAADLRDWLYELRWQPATLGAPDEDAPSRPVDAGSWLIFSDGGATSDTLRRLLEQRSQSCVLVEPGVDFAHLGPDGYRLDPARPQHFRRLLEEAFGEKRPPSRGVVHLWGLMAAPPAETSTDSLESARTLGAASVLHLVQALTLADWPDPPRLWLVTAGAQAVGPDVEPVSIAQAPLWGMGRSIEHEHPELRCTQVDLSSNGSPQELQALFQELCADSRDTDVALRDSRRYVARMVRYDDTGDRQLTRPPALGQLPAPDTEMAFRMEYPEPGLLDDIHARTDTRRQPGSEEVEIRVHATGLNFVDALRALGVCPGQDDGPVRLGIECAGTVSAVGDGVEGLHVGDAVVALAMDGVGSFVITKACLVAAKPADLSFEAATTIPIAFLTAYYAFHEQARLGRGERVLIHCAAGGVGLAAVQVARWLGATVYATAGTPEKRDYLRALGIGHVSDSRSLAFSDEVLTATDGEGVDVVLNSLTGEAIGKGLAALRPRGRFLEIGKRDIYQHGRLRLWQLRRNASYLVIDLAPLAVERPAYIGALLREIMAHVEEGVFQPLPVRTFPVAETAAAVRCLAQGKQIGKVVVSVDEQQPPAVEPAEFGFRAEATYLITGGLGGIGRAVATWMAQQGAQHLVLVGRGPASKAAQDTLDTLRAHGTEVVVALGDVTRADELTAVLESISASMPPLRGVVHAAGVLDDGILQRLDERRLREVMAPKVEGAWNLHRLTRDAALDFFVLFSSAASLLGSPGQAHYAAANAFLDALAWHRRAQGRCALSINWGPWAEIGLAARPERQRHLTQHGIAAMSPADGVRTLSYLLRRSTEQVAVLCVDWAQWRSRTPQAMTPPLFAELLAELVSGHPATGDARGRAGSLNDTLRWAGRQERRRLLESYLRDQAASKLGLAPSRLDIQVPLNQLGVDSLTAVELRNRIERDLGVVLPVVQLLNGPSVAGLADWLGDRLCSAGPAEPDPTSLADTGATQPDGAPETTDVAGSRWLDLLAQVPEVSDDHVDELLLEVLAVGKGQDEP